MINVITSIQIKEGKLSEFVDIFKSSIPNVIKEKGCLEYAPTIDVSAGLPPQKLNSNVVTIMAVLFERYAWKKYFQEHIFLV